jgi:hypothetical protein
MAVRTYNTYDMYGLLQGILDALGKHANAIPLQVRADLATDFIEALPGHPEDTHVELAPRITQQEKYKQQAVLRESTTPTVAPPLSPLGAFIAH